MLAGRQTNETLATVVDNSAGLTAIWGSSSKTSGDGVGVHGDTAGSNGTGVYGLATNASGTSQGVLGESDSPSGVGVYGLNAVPQPLPGPIGQTAIMGYADSGSGGLATGVQGLAPGTLAVGVRGVAAPGNVTVLATTGRTGVYGFASGPSGINVGVNGTATGSTPVGVHGETRGGGFGVQGFAPTGVGVSGVSITNDGGSFSSNTGFAISATGRLSFNSAGTVVITSGTSSVTVTPPVKLNAASLVLCTLQSNPGSGVLLKFVSVNATAGTFQIKLNKACTADTTAAWFVLG